MPARSVTRINATTAAPVSAPITSERTRITCSSRWPNCDFHFRSRGPSQLATAAFCGSAICRHSHRPAFARLRVPGGRNHFCERRDQFWSAALQLPHSLARKFLHNSISARRKFHKDNSMICVAMQSPQQSHPRKAVEPLDGGVVLHQKAGGEMLNGCRVAARHASDGQKKLELFRLKSGGSGGFLAIGQKQADTIAKLRERLEITFCQPRTHLA